jgi:predicted dehydrogenase
VDIVAVCDRNEDLARVTASRYGIPTAFSDAETMMKETRPDVVHILTPPQSHVELAEIAATFRAHMYIEKPLASSELEAQAIVQLSEQANVRICPGHNRLFDPPFIEASERIRKGEIGQITSVRVEQGFTYDAAARSATIPWSYTYAWEAEGSLRQSRSRSRGRS